MAADVTAPHGGAAATLCGAQVVAHGAEVLGQIPEADRLLHAVAVLLQSRSFPATAADLENGLARLLGISDLSRSKRAKVIHDQLRLQVGLDDIHEPEKVQELLLRAHNHAHKTLAEVRHRIEARHGTLVEGFRAFRRHLPPARPGAVHLVDTASHPGATHGVAVTSWAPALAGVGLESAGLCGVGAVLQLLSGALAPEVLPTTAVVIRLGCLPLTALTALRTIFIAKYRTVPHMLEVRGTPDGQGNLRQLHAQSWQAECDAMPVLEASADCGIENVGEHLFLACDANCNGSLDVSEINNAFSVAAPPTTLERMRVKVLLHWGSWRTALSELGVSNDSPLTPPVFVALAASLDVSFEDAHAIFRRLDTNAVGHLSWSELFHRLSTEAEGFTLQEFSLRLWLGAEPGVVPAEHLKLELTHMKAADAPLPPESFASVVCGVEFEHKDHQTRVVPISRGQSTDSKSRLKVGLPTKKASPGLLPSSPHLTEAEVLVAYHALRQKHGAASVETLYYELAGHHFLGDVLALDRNVLHPGETVTLHYRTVRAAGVADQPLLDHPFIAMVPVGLQYVPGGGGSWTLNRQSLAEVPGPKVLLRSGSREGGMEVPLPTDMSSVGNGPLEFRLFASADGRAGRQIGRAVPVVFQASPPLPPVVAAEALSPSSLRLLWEPPSGSETSLQASSFIVRGWPTGLHIEDHVVDCEPSAAAWSHKKQEMIKMCSHQVSNLVPGVTYQFQVATLGSPEDLSMQTATGLATLGFSSSSINTATGSATLGSSLRRQSDGLPTGSPHVSPHPSPRRPTAISTDGSGTSPRCSKITVVEGPPSAVVEVRMPKHRDFLPPPSQPQLIERCLGGNLLLEFVPQEAPRGCPAENLWVAPSDTNFSLLWDAPAPANLAASDAHDGFWPFPGRYWTRTREGDVMECLIRLPSASESATAVTPNARFRVLARSRDEEALSKPSEPLELLSASEEVLRDAPKLRELGEVVLSHGSLEGLLVAIGDAGLGSGGGKGHYADLRQKLHILASEAGGLEKFVAALEGLEMGTFVDSCSVFRSIRRHSGPIVDANAWDKLLKLVMEGGGPNAFTEGLGGLSVVELIATGPSLLEAGLIRRRGAGPDESGLLRDRRRASVLGAFGAALESTHLDLGRDQVDGYAKLLSTMMNSRDKLEEWTSCLNAVAESCGAADATELVQYAGSHAKALLRSKDTSGLAVKDLVELIGDMQIAGFVGPSSDMEAQHAFFRRVADTGGAPVLYAAFSGFDLRVLPEGIKVLHSAGLTDVQCLKLEVSGQSKIQKWIELANVVTAQEHGVEAALGRSEEAEIGLTGSGKEQAKELLKLSEKNGGHQVCKQILLRLLSAGGAARFLDDLGPLDLGAVQPIFNSVRKFGGTLTELEKIVQCGNQAGGVSKFLRIIHSIHDMEHFQETVERGNAMVKHLRALKASSPHLPEDRTQGTAEEHAKILSKVLGETSADSFMYSMSGISLRALLEILPLLIEVGLVRQRGQRTSSQEMLDMALAFLRWVLKAGGVQRVSCALQAVDARFFRQIMEVVKLAGLGTMQAKSLTKVGQWLVSDVNTSGGLEALANSAGGIDLFEACSLLTSLASGSSESLQTVQATLNAVVELAAPIGGLTQLTRLLKRLELQHLELMIEFLTVAGLQRPSSTLKVPPGESADEKTAKAQQAKVLELFEPWMKLSALASSSGGAGLLYRKAAAVDLDHFDACVELLRDAGLVPHGHGTVEERLLRHAGQNKVPSQLIIDWHRLVKLVAANGGPDTFMKSFQGVSLGELLQTVSLLRDAGLLQADVNEMQEKRDERRSLLQQFTKKVTEVGGLSVFWHCLKNVDLQNLGTNLYCLEVLRSRLSDSAGDPEDMWQTVRNPERLQDMLEALGRSSKGEYDLSQKQRERILRKTQEIGGVDCFLQAFENFDLKLASRQLWMLKEGGVVDPKVILELARLGQMVKLDISHLTGLRLVVSTLVKWTENRDSSNPESLWETLNQQVVWLLGAITENGALVQAVQKRRKTGGNEAKAKEPDLTPARLAQFLQALRPLGGIQGFLTAYRGLDLPTAAAQARVLYDASVRTVDTVKHLTTLFKLLHYDLSHLRGLNHFVRRFGATVMVDASVDALRTAERWESLAETLRVVAQGQPGAWDSGYTKGDHEVTANPSASNLAAVGALVPRETCEAHTCASTGPDRVLGILRLGLQLDAAAGLDAVPEEWAALCSEIRTRPGGLGDVLTVLTSSSAKGMLSSSGWRCRDASDASSLMLTSHQRASPDAAARSSHCRASRSRDLECRRCGNILDYRTVAASSELPRARSLSSLRRPGSAGPANPLAPLPRPDAAAADAAGGGLANALQKLRPGSADRGKRLQELEVTQWT